VWPLVPTETDFTPAFWALIIRSTVCGRRPIRTVPASRINKSVGFSSQATSTWGFLYKPKCTERFVRYAGR
jgi:hypothetical protein